MTSKMPHEQHIEHLTTIIEEQGNALKEQKKQLMTQTIQLQELWKDQAQGTGKWKRMQEHDQTTNMEKILELSQKNPFEQGTFEALEECELEVEKMGKEIDRLKTLLEAPSATNENLRDALDFGDKAWGGRRKRRKTKRRKTKRRKTKRRKTKRRKR